MKAPHPPSLTTARAIVRPYRLGDLEPLRQAILSSREHLLRFMWPWVALAEDGDALRSMLADMIDRFESEQDYFLVIASPEGRLCGGTAFHPVETGAAEIEFWVRSDESGEGLGHHVLANLLRWGFEDWGWDALVWRCEVDNLTSARVAQRCGLLYDGLLPASQRASSGAMRDTLRFRAVRDRWDRPSAFGARPSEASPLTSTPWLRSSDLSPGALSNNCPGEDMDLEQQRRPDGRQGRNEHWLVLDPAHGGSRPVGRSRPHGRMEGAQHANLELCRMVQQRVGQGLSLTREGDYNLSLRDRIACAHGGGAFLSVHCTDAPGDAVWAHADCDPGSRQLGRQLASRLGIEFRTGPLAVLDPQAHRGTPAVLLELGGRRGEDPAALQELGWRLTRAVQGLAAQASGPVVDTAKPVVVDLTDAEAYRTGIAELRKRVIAERASERAFLIHVTQHGQGVTLVMDPSDLYIIGFQGKDDVYHAVERGFSIHGHVIGVRAFPSGAHGDLGTADHEAFEPTALLHQFGSLQNYVRGKEGNARTALGMLVAVTAEAARFESVEKAVAGALEHWKPIDLSTLFHASFKNWSALTKANDADVKVKHLPKAQALTLDIPWNDADRARRAIERRSLPVVYPAARQGPALPIRGLPSSDLPLAIQQLVWALTTDRKIVDQSRDPHDIADNTLGAMRSWHANQYRHLPPVTGRPGEKATAYLRYVRALKTPRGVATDGGVLGFVEYSLGDFFGAHGRLCFDFVDNRVFLTTSHYGAWDKVDARHVGQEVNHSPGRYESPWLAIQPITEPDTLGRFHRYDPSTFRSVGLAAAPAPRVRVPRFRPPSGDLVVRYRNPYFFALETSNSVVQIRQQLVGLMVDLVSELAPAGVRATHPPLLVRLGIGVVKTIAIVSLNAVTLGAGSMLGHFIGELFDTHGPSNFDLHHRSEALPSGGSVAVRQDQRKKLTIEGALQQLGADHATSAVDQASGGLRSGVISVFRKLLDGTQLDVGAQVGALDAMLGPMEILGARLDDLFVRTRELEADPATLDRQIDELNLFQYLTYLSSLGGRIPYVRQRELWRLLLATTLTHQWDDLFGTRVPAPELWQFLQGKGLVARASEAPSGETDASKRARFDAEADAGGYLAVTSKEKFGDTSAACLRARCKALSRAESSHWGGMARELVSVSAYEGSVFDPASNPRPGR